MFNSTVLEVAIGLIFCYASVALIASSIYEAIASWMNLRSKTLLNGITELLNAKNDSGNELLLSIYNSALAHPTGNGVAESIKDIKNIPAYIPSKNFAMALIHSIQSVPGNFSSLSSDINAIKDEQLRTLLTTLHARAATNIESFQHEVANWFDSGMGRVSGAYKKQSQLWCFIIALAMAIIFNIDSVHLFKTLWQHPASVAQLNLLTTDPELAHSVDPKLAKFTYEQLQTLPIGWNDGFSIDAMNKASIFGWLITASATLFGAPFWFDVLKTLVRLRGTGAKPEPETRTQQSHKEVNE